MKIFQKIVSFLLDTVETLAMSMAVFVVVYIFLFQPMEVQGASSYPTLKTGERMIVEKISSHFGDFKRGDFLIPQSPGNPDIDYIKRVVGLPGEKIKIQNCRIFINDKLLDESYLSDGICT